MNSNTGKREEASDRTVDAKYELYTGRMASGHRIKQEATKLELIKN